MICSYGVHLLRVSCSDGSRVTTSSNALHLLHMSCSLWSRVVHLLHIESVGLRSNVKHVDLEMSSSGF